MVEEYARSSLVLVMHVDRVTYATELPPPSGGVEILDVRGSELCD